MGADIYVLQEVTPAAVRSIKKYLRGYSGYWCANDSDYWREWQSTDLPPTPNGVAIVYDPAILTETLSHSCSYGTGGRAAIVEGKIGEKSVRIVSLHLDNYERKHQETAVLLEYVERLPLVDVSIIAGDFNTPDISAYEAAGYTPTLRHIPTMPLYTTEEGHIDHTLYKGCYASSIVLGAQDSKDVKERYCETVKYNGSDHYATLTRLFC